MGAQGQYNNAKYWQIGFFSLNNAATNIYLALMGYISYYANSIAGFSIVLISGILTAQNGSYGRIFTGSNKRAFWKIPPFYAVRQSDHGI